MATRTETSHSYPYPAATVAGALVDPDYLRARLAKIGGEHAELLSYQQDADGRTIIEQRQGIPSRHLPAFVHAVVPGDIVIKRTETWRPHREGATCDVHATVSGAPAVIEGSLELAPSTPKSSTLTATLSVKVSVPFVGGKVEKVVVERLLELLDGEHKFTMEWLSTHH